jgi:hypothetical protein
MLFGEVLRRADPTPGAAILVAPAPAAFNYSYTQHTEISGSGYGVVGATRRRTGLLGFGVLPIYKGAPAPAVLYAPAPMVVVPPAAQVIPPKK